MTISPANPMRATAATLAFAMVLMGAAPAVAFCQAMCLPAEVQVAHQAVQAATHHHQAHAVGSKATDLVAKGTTACQALTQVALLRRQQSVATDRQLETAAPSDGQGLAFAISLAAAAGLHFPDRHGPPVLSPLVPLRV